MTPQSQQIIAVPYYGTLHQTRTGLAQIYFIAYVKLPDGCLNELRMAVWNPKNEPAFSKWLAQHGVNGILCSDDKHLPDAEVLGQHTWIQGGLKGDVEAMLSQWLNMSVRQGKIIPRQQHVGEQPAQSIRLATLYEGIDL